MRIAIVDDSQEMLEMIQSHVEDILGRNLSKSDIFKNPETLLCCMEDKIRYDIYLLDVEMPQISGLELAKKIRELQDNAYIIFITSHEEFALDSYDREIKAYNYILKNRMGERLPIVLSEAQREIRRNVNEYYILENQVRIEKIRIDEITHIYKEEKNSILVLGKERYKERKSLEKILQSIDKPEFIFVDRGTIVNMKFIRRIVANQITLMDGMDIKISRANIQKVKKQVSEYLGKCL